MRPVGVWLLIVAIFIGSHTAFYFQKPHFEVGDEAANALQIRNAKSFGELYGNYSRWGFHHPGPAWFYAYALGETLLFDTVRIVPAPFNAHLLTGVLLQAFFFTWAVTIVQRQTKHRLVTPLLLLFAGVHYSAVNFYFPDSVFQSIWPPHVLGFPFLCFLVAGASVASGQARDLVPLVLTGGVLAHSHVAQPLFIIPLALLAYAGPWLNPQTRKGYSLLWPRQSAPRALSVAIVILAIFLLPIAIDVFHWQSSNVRLIVNHFSAASGDRKSLAQSALYFASFLCYLPVPERYCDHLTLSSLSFLADRMPFLVMWAVIAATTVVLLRSRRPGADPSSGAFVRWLVVFFTVATGLTLVWGKLQNGAMFAFNSHFNFCLLFVPFILLGIAIASIPDIAARYPRPLLYALSVPLLVLVTKDLNLRSSFPSLADDNARLVAETRRAARQDKQAARTKFLIFEHHLWPQATGIGVALERYDYGFRVSPGWRIMFGAEHVADITKALPAGKVALWWLRSAPPPGEPMIANSPAEIDPAGSEITFAGENVNASRFAPLGWDISSGSYSWSSWPKGLIYFTARPAAADVTVNLHVFPADFSGKKPQRMRVRFNNGLAQQFEVWEESVLAMQITADEWNSRAHGTLSFEFPDAISPSAVGVSEDPRPISVGFTKITFEPVPARH